MEITFANPFILLSGLIAGIFFGFFLRKGYVCRFDVIVGQFLLKDFTVIKVMLTAIVVGSVGVYFMIQLGVITSFEIKSLTLWGNIIGGILFGIGMALLGLCPGTCVAALGEGAIHAIWGFLGMVLGVVAYAQVYDFAKAAILDRLDLGKVTLPAATHLSPWWFIAAMTLVAIVFFYFIERYEKRKRI